MRMGFESWIVLVPAGVAGLLALLFFFQHKLIYFPDVPPGYRAHLLDPVSFGLPRPEEVFLPMRDGVKVHMWLFLHPDSRERATVVFYHGNAGNISFRNENFKALYDMGLNVVAVEYRGFGKSEGTPSEDDLRSDSIEVLDWLLSRGDLHVQKIFLLGRSIGGAVAIHLAHARSNNVRGLIVENTFTCVADLVDLLMPKLSYFKFLLRNPWRNIDLVPNLRMPCMFISSGKDELIPRHMMQVLRESHGADHKEWHFYPEAQHMNAHTYPGYPQKVLRFVETVLSRKN